MGKQNTDIPNTDILLVLTQRQVRWDKELPWLWAWRWRNGISPPNTIGKL